MSLEKTHLYRDLAEREAKIRRLVDANIIGIFIWDFDGRILEANDAFLSMLGYDRHDLLAGCILWTELTPPDWRDREAVMLREHKMTGRLHPFEKEYFRRDGKRATCLRSMPMRSGSWMDLCPTVWRTATNADAIRYAVKT
jgi:PAS domain S-box-containing protein